MEEERDYKNSNPIINTPLNNNQNQALTPVNNISEEPSFRKIQIESGSNPKSLRGVSNVFDDLSSKPVEQQKSFDSSPISQINPLLDTTKRTSVLDPNEELKSKYNNIEEIRKNAIEKIENKKFEKR